MLDFKKSLDIRFGRRPTLAQTAPAPNTQTLAWVEIALLNTPHLVPRQDEVLAEYQKLTSPEKRFKFLTTANVQGVTPLEMLTAQIANFLKHAGTDHRKRQIKEVLENEIKNKDYAVVYRSSTPQHKCLVDIYSNIMSLLSMNSYAQAHRLFVDPTRSLTKFYQEFSQSNTPDNNYRNFGLYGTSGSLSLLDPSLYESAMFFWWNNIGGIHTNYRGHFESLMQLMKVKKYSKKYNEALSVINELLDLCDEFGSCMQQIFIHPSVVDDLLWVAKPLGKKRSTHHSTTNLLKGILHHPGDFAHEAWKRLSIFDDFQARVYLADKKFHHSKFVKTDFYYANPLNQERFKKYKSLRRKLTQLLLGNYLTNHRCTRKKRTC
jgi:hypothetical protein